ncbi:hypothetical protein CLU85_2380 [Acidovorax sp. 69]|uniref:hypothetical protein n=1 Tax=Acidovorax sp. 69 TaxID=2035202 RepID=UPI000CB1F1A4|nr:hypothetical protein [Acidovorax sp. 69]PJI97588.1 hypothetical protein CLU85_2380 [Acidovorax sp. 69]
MIRTFRPHPFALTAALRSTGRGAPWRSVAQRLALAWLLLTLVVVPTLGRLHQVAHGSTLGRVHAGQQALAWATTSPTESTANAAPPPAAQSHGYLLPLLLPHHAAAVDCLLLDQLALGDAMHSAPLALPEAVPPQALPMPPAGRTGAVHVALFQARGPPMA